MEPTNHRKVNYDGIHCHLGIEQVAPDVIVLRISRSDVGEFGDAPMQALKEWLVGGEPVDFFIDAREVKGASIDVSGEWATWLSRHKAQLRAVTMLTGSRFINLTAGFVRRFAALEGTMRICTEAEVFDGALREALGRR
jgi:hypothetical protein